MRTSTFSVPKMDCPSEERLIRLALEPEADVHALDFDLAGRSLVVHHDGTPEAVLARLEPLGFGAVHALDAIRSARPIAQVLYSDQVVSWFHRVRGSSSATLRSDLDAVAAWHRRHPVDGSWVISRIARRDMEESWGTRR